MKKKYAILFVIAVCLLALAGCNGESEVIADGDGPPELLEDDDKGGANMPIEDKVNINMLGDEVFITHFYFQNIVEQLEGAYQIGIDPDGYLIVSHLDYGFAILDASYDVSIPLSLEKYRELVQIIEDNDLASWDGFGQDDDPNFVLLDAGSFRLEVQWSDGSSIFAKSQFEPSNFGEVNQSIHTFFKSFLEEWLSINGIE